MEEEEKPKERTGITTVEASRILEIPLSMVEGLFERGILAGRKDRIAGRIVIDLESVVAFKREQTTNQMMQKKAET